VTVFKINAIIVITADCGQNYWFLGLVASHMETLYLHASQPMMLVSFGLYMLSQDQRMCWLCYRL
jgi:hypothetical protein